MEDPAVQFLQDTKPFWKITYAAKKDQRFGASRIDSTLSALEDEFAELDADEEVRITRVYMTQKEYEDLPEHAGW